jgi:DedD protein
MDIALKQRLVGASVLIALAVLVLPMLLGGRPEDGTAETQKIELPPQPSDLDFQTRRYPLGEQGAARPPEEAPPPGDTAEPGPGAVAHVEVQPRVREDALQAAGAPAEPAPADADDPDATRAATPEESSEPIPVPDIEPAAPAAGGGRYIVQVASFGSLDNAKRLAETLRGYGYGVLSDTVSSDVGTMHRVRVGPYGTEAEANNAVATLRNQIADVKPRIMDLRPDQAAQVTTPSDPLVRWVAQVGSFSSSDNADKLVERLRSEGLSAYRETVTSAGSVIYRVRAGPYVDRDEAIRVNGLVKERLSLEGVVMSAD